MRKGVLGLTTAAAIGVFAVPTVALAAHINGGGGHPSFSGGRSGSFVAHNSSGPRNFAVNNNVRNFNNNTRNLQANNGNWKGNRWTWNDRHHHHHDRDDFGFFGFVPFAAYGDYAAYDNCWQTQWTPNGYQRVYVCGPDEYGYF
jgi:hypothetical protein